MRHRHGDGGHGPRPEPVGPRPGSQRSSQRARQVHAEATGAVSTSSPPEIPHGNASAETKLYRSNSSNISDRATPRQRLGTGGALIRVNVQPHTSISA